MAAKPHRNPVLEPEEKRVVVTHIRPDTDALLCIWAARKYLLVPGGTLKIEFVRAGEKLSPDEMQAYVRQGFSVLHVDTGLGPFDQHGKQLGRTSSFELLVTALGVQAEPEIVPLLELANASDSAEKIDVTSIHYLFKSLPFYFYDKENKTTDWNQVLDLVTAVIDSMAAQWRYHADQKAKFDPSVLQKTASGKTIACLLGRPQLREAAFEAGADIVLFTESTKGGSHIIMQVSRQAEDVTLEKAIGALRRREATLRGMTVNGFDYEAIGKVGGVPGWYFHDSKKLISCGSRAHPLEREELSRMKPHEVADIVIKVL